MPILRESVGPFPRRHAHDYLGRLRMFRCDLNSIVDAAAPIRAIERFTVSQASRQRLDYVGCYWQAPYPCYVGELVVDATELTTDVGRELELSVLPFSFHAGTVESPWRPAASPVSLELGSWLLPGHGVVVLWRDQ